MFGGQSSLKVKTLFQFLLPTFRSVWDLFQGFEFVLCCHVGCSTAHTCRNRYIVFCIHSSSNVGQRRTYNFNSLSLLRSIVHRVWHREQYTASIKESGFGVSCARHIECVVLEKTNKERQFYCVVFYSAVVGGFCLHFQGHADKYWTFLVLVLTRFITV